MTKTDIILIVLDTQRADRLGCYDYSRAITPNLDRFASEATLFEQAVAPAQWTIPSHASMFSGLYPTAHQVLQSSHKLNSGHPHVAEHLSQAGYETVGFCNNPLVGILDNGLKRGFKSFYNYGGAVPSVPKSSSRFPRPLNRLAESYTQSLRRISYPIQNFFGRSDLAFQISLTSWLTPFWSKMANFKGQNERSAQDVVNFLEEREQQEAERPLFLFLNLMETHLPFWPPAEYIEKVAPYLRNDKEARRIMHTWNREAYRWAAPLSEPLSDLEHDVLNDLYDAEVAYQDAYLGSILAALEGRKNRENTLTVVVADHGDGLGDHGYMGHAFVAYEELVHVPLIVDWPARWPGRARIETPVSTRRVFHTIIDAVDNWPVTADREMVNESRRLSLEKTVNGRDPENEMAVSEVFPPLNFVRAIERRHPELLDAFHCLEERHAIVSKNPLSTYKLIQLSGRPHELYDLPSDSMELNNIIENEPQLSERLSQQLSLKGQDAAKKRARLAEDELNLKADPLLAQRLKGLGYLD
jgi:arylsulfatase A-like enzyme